MPLLAPLPATALPAPCPALHYQQPGLPGLLAAGLLGLLSSFTPPAPRPFTQADHGRTVTVGLGQAVRLRLASNPTTGYRWRLVGVPPQLQLTDSAYQRSPARAVGAAGEQQWTFQTQHKGRAVLRLVYDRAWEKLPTPAKRFTLTVVVP